MKKGVFLNIMFSPPACSYAHILFLSKVWLCTHSPEVAKYVNNQAYERYLRMDYVLSERYLRALIHNLSSVLNLITPTRSMHVSSSKRGRCRIYLFLLVVVYLDTCCYFQDLPLRCVIRAIYLMNILKL